MTYDISQIYNRYRGSRNYIGAYDPSYKKALNLVERSIGKNNSAPLSVIQGPPGTGKTTLFYKAIEDMWYNIDEDEVFVYIAPTNNLVADMLKKIVSFYPNKQQFLEEVRVYGSQFNYSGFEQLASRNIEGVKIILATDYQRIYYLTKKEDLTKFHLLIDEASKSPLHKVFIPLADSLLQKGSDVIGSFNVVGDPMQAISLLDMYRRNREEYLLMHKLIIKIYCMQNENICKNKNIDDIMELVYQNPPSNFYALLEETKRIPAPSHEIISDAFYGGRLRSSKRPNIAQPDQNILSKLKQLNSGMEKIADYVENAITTQRVGILHHMKGESYRDKEGDLYDDRRAKIGAYYGVAIAIATRKPTTIIAPYVEMSIQMRLLVRDLLNKLSLTQYADLISVNTVHAMLGGESENIVAVLGKEYVASDIDNNTYYTVYFNEPELLNVQFSRHKDFIVIIGDIGRLRSTAYKLGMSRIGKAAEKTIELAGCQPIGKVKSRFKCKGDGSILYVKEGSKN